MKIFLSLLISVVLISVPCLSVPKYGQKVLISAENEDAVRVGEAISHKKGANVVDIAVATIISLSVTNPYNATLGGGGFALIKSGKNPVEVLDFREVAPSKTSPDYYAKKEKNASVTGGAAIGVPGVPAGLWEMHKKYGKLHWSQLFRDAIELSLNGYRVNGGWYERSEGNKERFNTHAKKWFLNKGKSFRPGDKIIQSGLAKVLKEMRNRGSVAFYRGVVAEDIVKAVKESGGDMTMEDLKNYKVRWLKPLESEFEGHKVYLMPPPSSGGIVIKQALELMKLSGISKTPSRSIAEYHLMAEILKRSFEGRSRLGDPDFYENPLTDLMNPERLKKLADSIEDDEATKVSNLTKDLKEWKESKETTHISVLDSKGNAVSLTLTANGNFGSGVASQKFGILLNNEMDDFTTRPNEPNMFGLIQGEANKVEPGKRPLSSMSPTLVEKNGKIVMALGAPGGPAIISGVTQALYRVLVRKNNIDEAIQTGRVHHQYFPDKVFIDENRLDHETIKGLKGFGHEVIDRSMIGRVFAVYLDPLTGLLEGAFDSRGEGFVDGL